MTAKKATVKAPLYPRVMVSGKRHVALNLEAQKRGMTLSDLAEEKFKKADKKK